MSISTRYIIYCSSLLLLSSCSESGSATAHDAKKVLQTLAVGDKSPNFAGFEGDAIKKIREVKLNQSAPLLYDIRNGDSPRYGDGTCDFHVLVSRNSEQPPFIGLRMIHKKDGWHIAGYWTP